MSGALEIHGGGGHERCDQHSIMFAVPVSS
jgi:hypothetical protein